MYGRMAATLVRYHVSRVNESLQPEIDDISRLDSGFKLDEPTGAGILSTDFTAGSGLGFRLRRGLSAVAVFN